eukprot:CAMPEP_0113422156 /NCGR_PEP_ID=MMETSP0013_2-20120614/28308_1 /TAXON_ID=2843 ORGANISM="Skeletonema costatum, Strain 1716" /NCGR_SAMPLE_ID=MMETSP0013_2 /ASSEMBLY_ACC=CAM_ASM_000158 /LENGTH=970 /DNA_ID=CAMNT_0000309877 /DNA_START=150 /DNA_END=3062 /DNA_ORIENTATION=- /assembly_acc=CAM_ASM_000158
MKRALAERVKQEMEGPMSNNGPPDTNHHVGMNGMNNGLPPANKMPRMSEAPSLSSSMSMSAPISASPIDHNAIGGVGIELSSAGIATNTITSSTPSKKRPRSPNANSSGNVSAFQAQKSSDDENESTPKGRRHRSKQSANSDDEEGDDSNSSFYLKHQNQSLASELYAYRRKIYLLEKERDYRRNECRIAGKRIGELKGAWRGLEEALGQEMATINLPQSEGIVSNNGASFQPSTGLGSDVETINSLLLAIRNLVTNSDPRTDQKSALPNDKNYHVDDMNLFENYSKGTFKEEESQDLIDEKLRLDEMEGFATDISMRAASLKSCVLGLLRKAVEGKSNGGPANIASISELKEQIATLEAELAATDSRLEEMAQARNEATASERRVRRGLYRLASGRMSMEDVLKAVEKEDNGVSFMETLATLDGANENKASSSPTATVLSSPATAASKETSAASIEEVAQLKKHVQDVQVVAETREKKIAELLTEKEEQLKRINSLLLPKESNNNEPNDEAIRKTPLFIDMMGKLRTSERLSAEHKKDAEKIRESWAAAKGDLDLAKKTLADMEGKHERRWVELISQYSQPESSSKGEAADLDGKDLFTNAKKTAELEIKLHQALESVSRMDTVRATLNDALKMNEQLQSKLEDLKSKNAKMVAEKAAARASNKEADPLKSPELLKKQSTGSGDPTIEKLQRDYRRARKEVSAAVLSKDQAKLKQERAEKERDTLMKTNARLLKQSSEKDDMNAKSLSTILHLKQRNEELQTLSAKLKEKASSAQQLALAARLAANAKDRVGEEAVKEKQTLDEIVKQLKEECETLRKEKEQMDGLILQSKESTAAVAKDRDAARARCDELVSENRKKEDEKMQMMESLAVAKKEATEAAMKVASIAGSTGGGDAASSYTIEQLKGQVTYLDRKINCPVCNTREKKCILLRCRHMFCQQCVDVNIKNRSRKCPACAQRFDMKDVAEIWL